ncbi:hypothetical protein [Hyphomicrobium sp. 99]|uniref:hypothetical protein n=1 Tax=Hyphomicrobium sp. 99 TaxID=1163419 RepID=UPI0012E0B9CA|nr:hypothetical protein [Hyphomicrobium sp. 99]
MAHYKRRKARIHCPRAIRGSETSWRAKNKLKPVVLSRESRLKAGNWEGWALAWHPYKRMMNSYPKSWDILFHTRPKRRESRALEKKIIQGYDADGIVWPVGNHKPHTYYW